MSKYKVSHRGNSMVINAESPDDAARKVVTALDENTDYFNIIEHEGITVDMRVYGLEENISGTISVIIPSRNQTIH